MTDIRLIVLAMLELVFFAVISYIKNNALFGFMAGFAFAECIEMLSSIKKNLNDENYD